ncbi:hypothetical protein, partial [Pseudomonas monteilii]|uniref:hypothetical protein n=1 Tax=Pseudomonas monteilii TaxID=76759 RepID=UPI000534E139
YRLLGQDHAVEVRRARPTEQNRQCAGEATEYHYNAGHLSRLVYPDKTEDRFEHDAEGRLLSYTDALHRRTRWDYNEAGLIRQRH